MAIGTFSGGFFTIAIAVHTFGALVLQKRQSALSSVVLLSAPDGVVFPDWFDLLFFQSLCHLL
jgi:hypothetical protein